MIRAITLLAVLTTLGACAHEPLEGAWRSQVQFSSGDFAQVKDLEFLYVFNHAGTMTESSNYDSAPPVPPAYGVWRCVGQQRYEAKYIFYTTKPPEQQIVQGWRPSGSGELTEQIGLSADGKSLESKIKLQLFDASGKPIAGGGEATGRGKRIHF
jgi:hypothetical protein